MKISIYDTYDAMSEAAAELVAQQLAEKPSSILCFPSGDSPTGMLNYIVQWANDGKIDLSQSHFVALDEWVGMDENDEGSCSYYFKHHFFSKLNKSFKSITMFNAKADNLDAECERINSFISSKGGLDIMMVGIGMNGHLGLNEPGTSIDLYAHHSALDPVTVQVGQKYFNKETVLTEGITLGLKHLAEAGKAVLIASGTKKPISSTKVYKERLLSKYRHPSCKHFQTRLSCLIRMRHPGWSMEAEVFALSIAY